MHAPSLQYRNCQRKRIEIIKLNMIHFTNIPEELQAEQAILKNWLKELIRSKALKPGDVKYFFCKDDELLKINLQFLQHDTYTDIITFDYGEGEMVSGEIYISEQRVRDNASNMGLPVIDELLRVVAHGVLHLCGYKDKTDAEAQEMRAQEEMAIRLYRNIKNR